MSDDSNVVIRAWTPADAAAIQVIYAHHVKNGASSWELTPPDTEEILQRAQSIVDAGYPYLVAERNNQVAGYAYASAYRPRPAYRFTVENSVYISEAERRFGIGKKLMTALISACTDGGYRQMIAIVGDSSNAQSIRFHETLGFEVMGTVRNIGFKFDRWMDQVILQRELGKGANTPPKE